MLAASPELINSIEINTKAFMSLSKIAFSSVERLATLNLNATRVALGDGIPAFGSLLKITDSKPQGLPGSTAATAADHGFPLKPGQSLTSMGYAQPGGGTSSVREVPPSG